ncbi:lipoate--protein ligase family protein [Arcobacter sp. F2176]|uniref:lipoate--protein ligase family protein n=1 Tax=Arcobacter sp. F2176 TaxID=2044511 RepID=UPI00100B6128|nr:lipoate--protein ligase family protein [Arcobacter sp. F2176]RXJ80329.1 ligase [Arcobacter sp. F2176]
MIEEKSSFRVIKDGENSARVNMATDDALISSFEENDKAILRVYHWSKSFTIGVSQDFSSYSFCDEYNGNYAKRVTGGGVLFHGHDLSYSLVIPTPMLKSYNIKQSYELICYFLLNFYKKLGLKTSFAKDDEGVNLSKNEFCQVGYEAYDILVNRQKIGGNAQRRTKKVIFQHGSIPLYSVKKSNTNLENENSIDERFGISLEDLNINLTYEEAKNLLIESFNESFKVELINSQLNEKEKKKKKELLKDKYDYAK